MILLYEKSFIHGQVNEKVAYKILASLNSPRKPKILLFFVVVDLGTIGYVTT